MEHQQPDIRGMYPPIGNSDHNVAMFEVSLTLAVHSGTCATGFARPDYSKADWNGINNYLLNCNWNVIFADCTRSEEHTSELQSR